MICFCHFCKKTFCLFWVWPIQTPFFAQVVPKNGNFQRFQQKIFRTTGFQLKLLILIELPNISHWKPAKKQTKWVWSLGKIWAKLGPMLRKKVQKLALSIGFSHILHVEYILKQDVVVVQMPEWTFKANIARNTTFQGRQVQIFARLGSKIAKN